MSAPGKIQGELTQDRLPAIAGTVGSFAPMIPVRLRFSAGGEDTPIRFGWHVIPRCPQDLSRWGWRAFWATGSPRVRGTLRVQATLKADDLPPVQLDRWYSATSSSRISVEPAIDIARVFSWLWAENWGEPPKLSLDVVAVWSDEPVGEYVDVLSQIEAEHVPERQ